MLIIISRVNDNFMHIAHLLLKGTLPLKESSAYLIRCYTVKCYQIYNLTGLIKKEYSAKLEAAVVWRKRRQD